MSQQFQLQSGERELTFVASKVTLNSSAIWLTPNVSIGDCSPKFHIDQWVASTKRITGPKLSPNPSGITRLLTRYRNCYPSPRAPDWSTSCAPPVGPMRGTTNQGGPEKTGVGGGWGENSDRAAGSTTSPPFAPDLENPHRRLGAAILLIRPRRS
jgi:hypothetical protein